MFQVPRVVYLAPKAVAATENQATVLIKVKYRGVKNLIVQALVRRGYNTVS